MKKMIFGELVKNPGAELCRIYKSLREDKKILNDIDKYKFGCYSELKGYRKRLQREG